MNNNKGKFFMHHTTLFTPKALIQTGIFSMLAFTVMLLGINDALAGAVQLCNGIVALKSDIGKGVSTLGVMGVAIAATFGKVSWGMAVLVAVGIAAVHSAGTIAGYFGGTGCAGM
jgi:hypothetical protein